MFAAAAAGQAVVEAALEKAGAFGLVVIDEEYREAVMEKVAGI